MIKINYTNKINNILNNSDIWEKDNKTINKESINKTKMELGGANTRDLDRLLLAIESVKEDESLPLVSLIGLFSIIIGILAISINMFELYFWCSIILFVIIVLIVGKVFFTRESKIKENNIKIKNIEIALIELLKNRN